MRKLIPVVFLMVAAALFATGTAEEPQSITVLMDMNAAAFSDGTTMRTWGEEATDLEVEYLSLDLSDGSTLTMDALIAAGKAPDVYFDYIGRVSKYLVPEYAMPLQDKIDVSAFSGLAAFTRNGDVLGLPASGGAQGMAINLEIMGDIGYTVPDLWTIADFLEMADLVKQHYGGEKWATGMFAGNQSGDYLINNWFASFGAELYGDGYESTTIAEKGARVHDFFQHLVQQGYVPPGSATLVDDDYVIQWAKGDLAATAFFESWTKPYFDSVISQGLRSEPFEYTFVPFPRAQGVENVPTYMSYAAFVAHKDAPDAAADWIAGASGVEVQSRLLVELDQMPSRTDITAVNPNPRLAEITAIVQAGGIMDVGLTSPQFAAVRPQHYPVLQKVLNLTIEPQKAIEEYAARVNEALR